MVTFAQHGARVALRPCLVALCLLVALGSSIALVSPAEARGQGGRATTAGWSTTSVVLSSGERRGLRVSVRGAKRAARTVVLQRRADGGAWTSVDRARSGRKGHATLVVPGSEAFRGQLRVVVPAARGARTAVTAARTLVVRARNAGVTATGPRLSPEEREVVRLVNEARKVARSCGGRHYAAAPALRVDDRLSTAGRGHARDMGQKGYFSHDSADGRSPWRRAEDAGYRNASGENIAAGQRSASEVVDAWLASDGHCANIMSADARDIGVGLAVVDGSPYGWYWVQMFGRG